MKNKWIKARSTLMSFAGQNKALKEDMERKSSLFDSQHNVYDDKGSSKFLLVDRLASTKLGNAYSDAED
jgi:hypothetical protein